MKNFPQLIVDGYNYIFRNHGLKANDEDALWRTREELVHDLIAYRGNKRIQITVVFDGQDVRLLSKTPRPAGIRVLFSKAPQKADPLIIKLVQQADKPGNITVVTSDRTLASSVRKSGCQVWTSEELKHKMKKRLRENEYKNKYDASLSPEDLNDWLNIFNQDGESETE